MFGKLKNKLKSFLGKPEEEKKESEEEKSPTPKSKAEKLLDEIKVENEEKPKEKKETNKPKESFVSKISKKLDLSTTKLKQENLDSIFEELELILLENNVALEVVDKIKEDLSKELVDKEINKKHLQDIISESLKESISNVLIEPENLLDKIKNHSNKKPFTILFFGINGSGKTTSIAKIAHMLKEKKISCVLGAGDTFRAASIEQLEKHGRNLDIKVIKHNYGSDPAAVGFDTKKYAQQNNIECALIDTAGRMYTKSNLLNEMEKIVRVVQPDLKIFVAESTTGNDAVEQAKKFNETIGIDGIIMTKADVDEKAGAILSVSYVTKKPVFFLGTGQEYSDLKPFNKKEVLKNLGLD